MEYFRSSIREETSSGIECDINRNCCYFETPKELEKAARELCKAFGGKCSSAKRENITFVSWSQHTNANTTTPGVARYKNMFSYNSRAAASKFHYRALMLNLVFDSGLTYRQLCKNSKKLWDEYVQAPPDNPSVNWGRWKEEGESCERTFSSVDFAKWPRLFDM